MADSITPSPELIEQWMQAHSTKYDLARHAAQWGADTELEACAEIASIHAIYGKDKADWLRSMRRPKPPSLKEQAIAELDEAVIRGDCLSTSSAVHTIRRALEALPDD